MCWEWGDTFFWECDGFGERKRVDVCWALRWVENRVFGAGIRKRRGRVGEGIFRGGNEWILGTEDLARKGFFGNIEGCFLLA